MLEFLRSGRLGELERGLAMERVRQLLGPPKSCKKALAYRVWVYGALQLLAFDDRSAGIVLYYRRLGRRTRLRFPDTLQLDERGVSADTTHDEFLAILSREAIPFVDTDAGDNDFTRVSSGRAPSTVESWFGPHNGPLHLVSFRREIARPKEEPAEE